MHYTLNPPQFQSLNLPSWILWVKKNVRGWHYPKTCEKLVNVHHRQYPPDWLGFWGKCRRLWNKQHLGCPGGKFQSCNGQLIPWLGTMAKDNYYCSWIKNQFIMQIIFKRIDLICKAKVINLCLGWFISKLWKQDGIQSDK